MNDSRNSSKGLLVLRMVQPLTNEQVSNLAEAITPTANALGLEPMVLGNGADIRIENGRDALLERVCVALEALAAQDRAPELSEAQSAPQGLNVRPSGLNSRLAVCKGAPELGTACGKCSRCEAFGWVKADG